jgi:hypothetical protein
MPTAKPKRTGPDPVLKSAVLYTRTGVDSPTGVVIAVENVSFTSFNLNAGVLTLFTRAAPTRILAPGQWLDLQVIGDPQPGEQE